MGMLYRRKEIDPVTGVAKRTGRWLIKYYDDGKPYYQSTGTYDKAEAKKVLEKVLEELRKEDVKRQSIACVLKI